MRTTSYHKCRLCFIWWLVLSLSGLSEGSYSVTLEPKTGKCFHIILPENQVTKMSGTFELVEENRSPDSLLFVMTRLGDSDPIFTAKGQRRARFQISGHGKYKVCVENGVSRRSDGKSKRVGFSFRVKASYDIHTDSPGPLTEYLTKIDDLTDEMLFGLEELLDNLEIMKMREKDHRSLAEQTYSNVWKWTLIEKFILVMVSVAQIGYYKSFFRKRGVF